MAQRNINYLGVASILGSIIVICVFTELIFLSDLSSKINSWIRLISYHCIILSVISTYFLSVLDPGTVIVKGLSSSLTKCKICDAEAIGKSHVHHCKVCGVCIEGFDQHWEILGICIGNNNRLAFIGLLVSSSITLDVFSVAACLVVRAFWPTSFSNIEIWIIIRVISAIMMFNFSFVLTSYALFQILLYCLGMTTNSLLEYMTSSGTTSQFSNSDLLANIHNSGETFLGFYCTKVFRVTFWTSLLVIYAILAIHRYTISSSFISSCIWMTVCVAAIICMITIPVIIFDRKALEQQLIRANSSPSLNPPIEKIDIDEESRTDDLQKMLLPNNSSNSSNSSSGSGSCSCAVKLPLSHFPRHCMTCDTCIPGGDHHCGIFGVCIGFHNRLLYSAAMCSAVSIHLLIFLGLIGPSADLWTHDDTMFPYLFQLPDSFFSPSSWRFFFEDEASILQACPLWTWIHILGSFYAALLTFLFSCFLVQQIVYVIFTKSKGVYGREVFVCMFGAKNLASWSWYKNFKLASD